MKSREVRGYGLVKKETNNKQYYYHQNEHGDITHLTNTDSEVENSYQYDVFGNIREQQENVENVFKYAGEQLDSETQQYYLRARFYNPVIARFTQEDVYRGDGLNLYVYVVNNPLLWFDSSGYEKCSKTPENTIKAGKPGSPSWKESKKAIKEGKGKGINIEVSTEEQARQLLNEARRDMKEYEKYTKEPYKKGFEVHPAEPNVGNNLPHIKWKDWSTGKGNGANGHIFFGGD